jgi:chorismate mutase / prephenate dehydratase
VTKAKSSKSGVATAKKSVATGFDLAEIRHEIDSIDRDIQALIDKRAHYAQQVGAAKGPLKSAIDYYRPEREAHVLRMVLDRNANGVLPNDVLIRVFREIMSACLAQQEPLKVGYLGPEGTFSELASKKHFGHSVHLMPLVSIEEVFAEVEAGHIDFGVVPVENSAAGAVNSTLDMFLTSSLKITGEVELKIEQNLMGLQQNRTRIKRVYSHPQSLAQCRNWLRQHLPKAKLEQAESNAEAARRARQDDESAAIGSAHAASIYGLQILEPRIQDRADNTTRFLVIGREMLPPSSKDKTSLLMWVSDQPGALFRLLEPLSRAGINLNRIESRPSRMGKWDYAFFVDIDGHVQNENLRDLIAHLEAGGLLKVLGSYPVAVW